MKSEFDRWSLLAGRIISAEIRAEEADCPHCGARTVRCMAMGDPATRIGYALCWCDTCLNGIHISRMKASTAFTLHEWGDKEAIAGIPEFHHVTPPD